MLNRIVRSDKNQIVTLQVVDELRPVKVQSALQALEKNLASRPAQKVILDLNNLQVLSQPTQELLGLLVRHVRLQNIPISFTGNEQLDPATLLTIAEGRPDFHEYEEEEVEEEPEQVKFFSRFSAPPFFAKPKNEKPQATKPAPVSEPVAQPDPIKKKAPLSTASPQVSPAVKKTSAVKQAPVAVPPSVNPTIPPKAPPVAEQQSAQNFQNQPSTAPIPETDPFQNEFDPINIHSTQTEIPKASAQPASAQPQPVSPAENEPESKEYKFWFRIGLLLFSCFTAVAVVLVFLLWPEFESGNAWTILEEATQTPAIQESVISSETEKKVVTPKALAIAVSQNDYDEAARMLATGVNPEYLDSRGHSPLMKAVQLQNPKMVRLLAEHGANINRSDKLEDTPLVWAASKGDTEIVNILMEFGASPDRGNFTPLMWAAFHGDLPMLKQFIAAQANLNARTREGWTALMWASEQGHVQVIWALLENGARLNIQNNDGQTALMLAARRGRMGAANLLLTKGADGYLMDFDKKSALDHAQQHNRKDVIRLLKKELGNQ